MRDAGWGGIINISSGGAWQPFAAIADYTPCKAAALSLIVSLSREFADTGVTVNGVRPGDIANVVALIALPLSGYMNGANYRIDGSGTNSIN